MIVAFIAQLAGAALASSLARADEATSGRASTASAASEVRKRRSMGDMVLLKGSSFGGERTDARLDTRGERRFEISPAPREVQAPAAHPSRRSRIRNGQPMATRRRVCA